MSQNTLKRTVINAYKAHRPSVDDEVGKEIDDLISLLEELEQVDLLEIKVCDCGAKKLKLPHSRWCSTQ